MARPQRLSTIFQEYSPPLYFITFCVQDRRACLNEDSIHDALVAYATRGVSRGVGVGRYVIMPDHVHLFVRGGSDFKLGEWVKGLKRALGAAAGKDGKLWQPGYFDHVVRHSESYEEKWHYVRENPVRKGLVDLAEQWLFQGEIVRIDRA